MVAARPRRRAGATFSAPASGASEGDSDGNGEFAAPTAWIIAASLEQKEYMKQIENVNQLSSLFAARQEKAKENA
jgi:hypothetical protein